MMATLKTIWICTRCGRRHKHYVKKCASCQGTLKKKTIVDESDDVAIKQLRLDKRGRHAGTKTKPPPTVYLKDIKKELT